MRSAAAADQLLRCGTLGRTEAPRFRQRLASGPAGPVPTLGTLSSPPALHRVPDRPSISASTRLLGRRLSFSLARDGPGQNGNGIDARSTGIRAGAGRTSSRAVRGDRREPRHPPRGCRPGHPKDRSHRSVRNRAFCDRVAGGFVGLREACRTREDGDHEWIGLGLVGCVAYGCERRVGMRV